MRIRAAGAACAAVAVTVVATTSVGAKPLPVTPSSITIESEFSKNGGNNRGSQGPAFKGKVKSPKAKCKRNRHVILYAGIEGVNKRAARRAPDGFKAINVTTTTRRGNWVVAEPDLPFNWDGRVLARAPRHRGYGVRCANARSDVLFFFAR